MKIGDAEVAVTRKNTWQPGLFRDYVGSNGFWRFPAISETKHGIRCVSSFGTDAGYSQTHSSSRLKMFSEISTHAKPGSEAFAKMTSAIPTTPRKPDVCLFREGRRDPMLN